jgi:HAD superfamily hydrolase (TIGR01490 family)
VSDDGRPVVAAFDFDGTLTRGDTLVPFLQRLCGTSAVVRAMAAQAGAARAVLRGGVERDALKASLLARLLAGWDVAEVMEVVARYSDHVLARQLRPAAVERVTWHRDRGDHLVVVSASPELYVEPTARRLGFDAVLATRLEAVDGRLTGSIVGANVRGPEKVGRLQAHLGDGDVVLWAYGDSSGDRELLAAADVATRVSRRGLVRSSPPPRTGGA